MSSIYYNDDLMHHIESYFFRPKTKKELTDAINFYYSNKEKGIEKYGIINNWDVSHITDMSKLFYYLNYFNEPINLSHLDIEFTNHIGELYDFNGLYHSLIFKIDTLNMINEDISVLE